MVRYKNRALLIKVVCLDRKHCGVHLSPPILHEAIRKALNTVHGVKSAAITANFRVKYVNCWTNLALLTIRKSELMELRCALPFVTQLDHGSKGGRSVILRTIKVSGTIRGCQREIKKIHQHSIQCETIAEMKTKLIQSEMEIDEKLNIDE